MPATNATTAPAGYGADIAPVAALMADPARAAMLGALLNGPPLSAGELSQVAGISPATASAHLARLLDGGLVAVTKQGRHRYYRLAGHEVATVLEVIAQISPVTPVRGLRQSREAAALAQARTCYDHLAGRAGVELLDALLRARVLNGDGTGPAASYEVTEDGAGKLAGFGVDVAEVRRARRRFAGACLDWTQRRPHLNGALGAAITSRLLHLGWIERGPSKRAIRVTGPGRAGLEETFGWSAPD
ncbi:MAG TPA: helix-turn-helix transcriptional regulator [Streptosporangiaceae bacterium]|nr:helix-turn-helix transcriptional regulator [Streptosporangiaceae bacterium]